MNTTSDPNLPLIESARTLIDEGQLTEAAAMLNQARAQIPDDPRVYMMAGLMSEKAGNVAGAFQLMQRGLALAPQWAPGIVVLSQLQARQGHFAEAAENAATALQLEPENRVVLDGAINVAHLTGNLELAVRHLQQCLPGQGWQRARAIATHPRIAEAALAAGFGAVHGARPTLEAVAASIKSLHDA